MSFKLTNAQIDQILPWLKEHQCDEDFPHLAATLIDELNYYIEQRDKKRGE